MADPSPYVSRLQCVVHVEGGAATLLSIGKRAAPRCEARAVPPLLCRYHQVVRACCVWRRSPYLASHLAGLRPCGAPTSPLRGWCCGRRGRSATTSGAEIRRDLAEIRPWGGGDVAETWRRCGACGGEIVESERSVEK